MRHCSPERDRGRPAAALAALAACAAAACSREGPGPAPAAAGGWFRDATEEAGIDFVHETGAAGAFDLPEILGAGVALFDADADGDLDVYFTNGRGPGDAEDAGPTNRYFRQEADGRFADRTAASGLGDRGYGMGVAVADVDGDGSPDVYLANFGPDRLYRNAGDGTFREASEESGVRVDGFSSSAACFDYDRDGHLDLFVARYVESDPDRRCFSASGRPEYCGPLEFEPVPDVLLHNTGDGRFRDASAEAGVAAVARAGLGVVCEDLDDDGWPDVYVANDAYANQLWVNQRDGTFRDEALSRGAALNMSGHAEAGMGVVAVDLDDDLDLDLFMTHLRQETNTLYRNQGGALGFVEGTGESGLGPSSFVYTGFGVTTLDAELDGDLDVVVGNGRVLRGEPVAGGGSGPFAHYAERNLFYLNGGGGSFTLASERAPELCEPVEVTHGMVVGDVDRDGDLDLVLANVGGPARLYRNVAPTAGRWLSVRCVDPRLGRDAIGARVTVHTADRAFLRTIGGGAGYLSAGPPEAHFGLGRCAEVDAEVRWPDGLVERFAGLTPDRGHVLVRGEGAGG